SGHTANAPIASPPTATMTAATDVAASRRTVASRRSIRVRVSSVIIVQSSYGRGGHICLWSARLWGCDGPSGAERVYQNGRAGGGWTIKRGDTTHAISALFLEPFAPFETFRVI